MSEPRPRKNVRVRHAEAAAAPQPAVPVAKPQLSDAQRTQLRAARLEQAKRVLLQSLNFARTGVGLLLAVGLAGALSLGARSYAQQSSRFVVQSVSVSGNAQRTEQQLLMLAGLSEGVNIFTVHAEDARAKLLQDPWIESAEVTRKLPNQVQLSVVERKAAALVALGDTMLSTREGEVFKRLEPGDPMDLPVVTCLDSKMLEEDPEGVRKAVSSALTLLSEYEAGKLAKRYPVEELCARADGRFTLVVGKDGLSLRLGTAPYRRKLLQAERVLFELERRRAKADVVLLDNEARPDRVVVRMR